MSTKLYEYAELLKQRYAARRLGNSDLEDEILDLLDGVWLGMTERERAESKQVALATRALCTQALVKSGGFAGIFVATFPIQRRAEVSSGAVSGLPRAIRAARENHWESELSYV